MFKRIDFERYNFDSKAGLFLPKNLARLIPKSQTTDFTMHILTFISGKEIYNIESTIEEVGAMFRPFALKAVLAWLSAINLSLEKNGILDYSFQETIAAKLFPNDAIFNKIINLIRRRKSILVHSSLVETLERLAVLYCDGVEDDREKFFSILGEVIIRCVDCIDSYNYAKDFDEKQKLEKEKILCEFSVRNFSVNNNENHIGLLRYLIIFRDLSIKHIGNKDYLDLKKDFFDFFGISLADYCSCVVGLLAYWSECGVELNKPMYLKLESLFENTSISEEVKSRFLKICALSVQDAKGKYQAELISSAGFHYDRLSIYTKPLIIIDDSIICLSIDYFANQIGNQLYWRFVELFQGNNETEKFLRFFGFLFHRYVSNKFINCVGDRFKSDIKYKVGKRQGDIDGLIIYPDCIIVIEVKGTKLTYETKRSGNYDKLKKDLKKIISEKKGVGQLNQTITDIREGHLNDLVGMDVSKLTILPVLILPEPFPIEPLLWDVYASIIEENNWLIQKNVRPLTVINAEEVEILSDLPSTGNTIKDIFLEKTNRQIDCACSMKNFLIAKKIPIRNREAVQMYQRELNEASKKLFGTELKMLS